MSFGVYVTGSLSETASIVSFLLIAHGYCIISERLSVPEHRAMAVIGCVFYLILLGHRTPIPCIISYCSMLYRKLFKGAMHIVAIAETVLSNVVHQSKFGTYLDNY